MRASNRPPGPGSDIFFRTMTATPASAFRGDIQGLRAIAVLTVMVGHAGLGPFTGGFVGVDVFFVISGFLITQLLLAEAERSGRVSMTGFYARRARRILPAATVVLVVTVLARLVLLSALMPPAWSATRRGRPCTPPTSTSPSKASTTSPRTPRRRRSSTTGRSRSRSSSTSSGRCCHPAAVQLAIRVQAHAEAQTVRGNQPDHAGQPGLVGLPDRPGANSAYFSSRPAPGSWASARSAPSPRIGV